MNQVWRGGVEVDRQLAEVNAKLKKLSVAGKIIKNLIIGSILVPFCAVMTIGMYRNIESVALQVQAQENSVYMGEFDPTMGEKITTNNGRALVVVHEGYGMEVFPDKYNNLPEYQEYLRKLAAEIATYRENGDPVVFVYTDLSLAKGLRTLEPKTNTMYYVTQANNGFSAVAFTSDGKSYSQRNSNIELDNFLQIPDQGKSVWDILKEAGVTEVEMAGEFRGACPSQVAAGIEDIGIKVGWCDNCAFPTADTPELLEIYPTLEPLP